MSGGIDVRPIGRDELDEFMAVSSAAFGWTTSADDREEWDRFLEYDRTLAAFDGERMVATSGAISFQLTLPGEVTAPAAGVTVISVLPTHRRRGILTEIMRRQLADFRRRQEPLAILLASESLIYGRYGYGLAMTAASYEIERHRGALRQPFDHSGSVRIVDTAEASRLFPDVYEQVRIRQPGFVSRNEEWWSSWFKDPERHRREFSARFYVVYEEGGAAQGYLAYRVKPNWDQGIAQSQLLVQDFMAATPASYVALWQYCLSADLVESIQIVNRPLDEPLRWMLTDPRRLRFQHVGDHLWARLVDVASALACRRYLAEGTLTLSVTDPFTPENDGVYRLEGGPDGATCRRITGEAEIELRVDDLGALYLGGTTFTTLARAGRVKERRPGALHRADALFATDRAPWCPNHF